jgi:hypothetical protein
MHTQDDYNGVGEGQGNYLFTSKVAGEVSISGKVWDTNLYYGTSRPQEWILLLNGEEIASGTLSGAVSRSGADTFNVQEPLTVGSTIELELERTSTFGYFVGAQLTVSTVPTCLLSDKLSYSGASDTLRMNFNVGNNENSPVTWNTWLTYQKTIKTLFSVSQPITNPATPITKTATLSSPEGEVEVLSTLTTATGGIVCSSLAKVQTGTP